MAVMAVCAEGRIRSDAKVADFAEKRVERCESNASDRTTLMSS